MTAVGPAMAEPCIIAGCCEAIPPLLRSSSFPVFSSFLVFSLGMRTLMLTSTQKLLLLFSLAVLLLLVYLLQPILTPFLVGLALAYLGDPVVDRLQTWRLGSNRCGSTCFHWFLCALGRFNPYSGAYVDERSGSFDCRHSKFFSIVTATRQSVAAGVFWGRSI